jgi:hypothetical protein
MHYRFSLPPPPLLRNCGAAMVIMCIVFPQPREGGEARGNGLNACLIGKRIDGLVVPIRNHCNRCVPFCAQGA